MNTEEYVPINTPTMSAKANVLISSPEPGKKEDNQNDKQRC